MKYIVRSQIDIDHKDWRPGQKGRVTPEWVKDRLDLFHNYTLKSILNMTEDYFDIWVFCGQCYKAITSNYNWHPRVKVIYDMNDFLKSYITNCEEDYLTIARIDSDDLYHKDALNAIMKNLVKDPNDITRMAFRRVYSWDRWSNVLGKYHQSHPPQFVHTIPKKRYKDFEYFMKFHFTKHVGGSHNASTLPDYYFCETRHNQSWTIRKRHSWSKTYQHDVLLKETKQRGFNSGKYLAIEKEGLFSILKNFGVERDLI